MKLTEISIANFRNIRKLQIGLDPNVTVLIGRNGIGGTSILDAISLLLRPVSCCWPDSKGRRIGFRQGSIRAQDVRWGTSDSKISLRFALEKHKGDPIVSELSFSEGAESQTNRPLHRLVNKPREMKDKNPCLSTTSRTVGLGYQVGHEIVMNPDEMLETSLSGDLRAIGDLEAWWDQRDAAEARTVRDKDSTHRDPQLEAIRELIKEIDSFTDISFGGPIRHRVFTCRSRMAAL